MPEEAISTVSGRAGLELQLEPGGLIAETDPALVLNIDEIQLNPAPHRHVRIVPRIGHHYSTRLLSGVAPDIIGERQVFRLLSRTTKGWFIDLNDPLAGSRAQLSAQLSEVPQSNGPSWNAETLRWRVLHCGAGLQARREDVLPDWPTHDDLKREDETDDSMFYTEPRFVTQIDDTTIAQVSALYARLIKPGARVLDIMSSWISHMPDNVPFKKVTGLGMNQQELAANAALDEITVHDLNRVSRLPFPDNSFDAIVCAVSVEYLSDPLAVFEDVRRVLSSGGVFINAFSNRCFPTKAIALWAKLHEFERMGLVAHFYHRTGYSDVNTWSLRGLPRPAGDPYAGQSNESDPVYAVWANN